MKRNYVVTIWNKKAQQVAEYTAAASSATTLHKEAIAEAKRRFGDGVEVSLHHETQPYPDSYYEEHPVANGYADYLEYFYGEDR